MAAACSAAKSTAEESRASLIRRRRQEKTSEALWQRLKVVTRLDRLDLVAVFPEFKELGVGGVGQSRERADGGS